MNRYFFLLMIFLCFAGNVVSQSPGRLAGEVNALELKYKGIKNSNAETIVFTGSSSIRFWENLEELFPQFNVVNTGFGGSMTSDLLAYLEVLVLKYNPKKVFIYEGDNDIEKSKSVDKVFRQIRRLVRRIQKYDQGIEIVLIGVKPCPERWYLREKYQQLNRQMADLARETAGLEYVDLWENMLKNGNLQAELYVEDGIHLSEKGYSIFYTAIKEHLK